MKDSDSEEESDGRQCLASLLMLAGPTAVGKSEIGLFLAERVGGEILSVDSMQIYRGLDIGTAKPSPAELARIPHHLVDVADIDCTFDASQFVRLARKAIREIRTRGNVPVLSGGTGLYFNALLFGLGQGPAAEPSLRAELENTPLADLLRELASEDPVTFATIDQKNSRRVIRAVEVIRLTGKPYSKQRVSWHAGMENSEPLPLFFGLTRAPDDLHRRIDKRVEEMFERGLVPETQRLLARGLAKNPTAMQALGYRQVVDYLSGKRSLAETIAIVKIRTRQLAKRQMTWFRRQVRLNWIRLEPESDPMAVAEDIALRYQSRSNIAEEEGKSLSG